MSLEDDIFADLKAHGLSKARDIADRIKANEGDIKTALYGPLRGKLVQDAEYRWSLPTSIKSGQAAAPKTTTPLARLARYYLECLSEGDGGGVQVFASSYEKLDYVDIGALPKSENQHLAFESPGVQEIVSRCRRPRERMSLKLGLPVLVMEKRSRKGNPYYTVEPLLLWAVDPDEVANGFDVCTRDFPSLNFEAVSSLVGSPTEALEEILQLSQELGLASDSKDVPEPEDVVRRLRFLRPDWPWKEPTDSTAKGGEINIPDFRETGILNKAVLVATEDSKYTKGLREELDKLASAPGRQDCALASWISGDSTRPPLVSTDTLLEILPLNTEQRDAVQRSLTQPLTVITGPPGTGKSQVVSSILINAAHRGMRILFASKNNQAVDVVEDRVNGLGERPVLLRLGGKQEYTAKLKDYLTRLLAGTAGAGERQEFDAARGRLDAARGKLKPIQEARELLVDARNTVDSFERASEAARTIFEDRFEGICELDLVQGARDLGACQEACRRADRRRLSLFERIIWPFLRSGRIASLESCLSQLGASSQGPQSLSLAQALGLDTRSGSLSQEALPEIARSLTEASVHLELAEKAKQYWENLRHLQQLPSLETLTREEARFQEELTGTSLEFWRAWVSMRPAELNDAQRRMLAEYAAVLELLSNAQLREQNIEGSLWRKYFDLSEKVVSVLSCWAVTSLSVKGRVPFAPSVFDLLVIDEASQCDIASALPLLYRSKRAVIIGDPMQLKHISALTGSRDQQLLQKHGLAVDRLPWSYSVNSVFDLARSLCRGEDIVMLRDHHRSHPDIIGFSNIEFYDQKLRVATKLDRLRPAFKERPSARWIDVRGHAIRPADGGLINEVEAQAIVKEVRRLILDQKYGGSVGVTSPFRAQVNRIRQLVAQDRDLQVALDRADFIVDSVHRFQGDERDVILFSPAISSGDTKRALGFLRSQPNIFNVAVTRARAALIVVGDNAAARDPRDGGVEYLSRFSDYVSRLGASANHEAPALRELGPDYPQVGNFYQVSDWEKILYRAMHKAGLRPLPQYSEEKYTLDFALLESGRKLNIEVDGEMYHRAWNGELIRKDQLRNLRLMELGWDVMRFWVYEVRDDLEGCVTRVQKWAQLA